MAAATPTLPWTIRQAIGYFSDFGFEMEEIKMAFDDCGGDKLQMSRYLRALLDSRETTTSPPAVARYVEPTAAPRTPLSGPLATITPMTAQVAAARTPLSGPPATIAPMTAQVAAARTPFSGPPAIIAPMTTQARTPLPVPGVTVAAAAVVVQMARVPKRRHWPMPRDDDTVVDDATAKRVTNAVFAALKNPLQYRSTSGPRHCTPEALFRALEEVPVSKLISLCTIDRDQALTDGVGPMFKIALGWCSTASDGLIQLVQFLWRFHSGDLGMTESFRGEVLAKVLVADDHFFPVLLRQLPAVAPPRAASATAAQGQFMNAPDFCCQLVWALAEAVTSETEAAIDLRERLIRHDVVPRLRSLSRDSPRDSELLDQLHVTLHGCAPKERFDRHDNDHARIRDVVFMPEADELQCKRPSYLPLDPMAEPKEADTVCDRQFRLLREDFVNSIREDLQVMSASSGKGRSSTRRLQIFRHVRYQNDSLRVDPSGVSMNILFAYPHDHRIRSKRSEKERFEYVKAAKRLFPRDGVVALRRRSAAAAASPAPSLVAIGVVVDRDERSLCNFENASIRLAFCPAAAWHLLRVEETKSTTTSDVSVWVDIEMVTSAITTFTYEPVLRVLQSLKAATFPFGDQLLYYQPPVPLVPRRDHVGAEWISDIAFGSRSATAIVNAATRGVFTPTTPHNGAAAAPLYDMQRLAYANAIQNNVTVIQGPPGTGKTHVGVEIANALLQGGRKLLLLCYTNHALDQFILKIAQRRPQTAIARLGTGHRDEAVAKYVWQPSPSQMNADRTSKDIRRTLHEREEAALEDLSFAFGLPIRRGGRSSQRGGRQGGGDDAAQLPSSEAQCFADYDDRFQPLLFTEHELDWWERKIEDEQHFPKPVNVDRLFQYWKRGTNDRGGIALPTRERDALFALTLEQRNQLLLEGEKNRMEAAHESWKAHSKVKAQFARLREEEDAEALHRFEIVACTVTFAAKKPHLFAGLPGRAVMIEETAEILEAQLLACIPSASLQLIMIGDHKQLRPKIASFHLQVASGQGFNLNKSLFERLYLGGFPVVTLNVQQRMFPALSRIVRSVSYPDLIDAPKGLCPDGHAIPGFVAQLQFVNHAFPEKSEGDDAMSLSHQNEGEAEMVARTVKYLLQQQIVKPASIVVLSAYLGQVRLIKTILQTLRVDSIFNEVTKDDIDAAYGDDDGSGDVSAAAAENAAAVRVSTIDNFQGEEADYIIASLVRTGQPGFIVEAERVTVLMSRAKKGMLLFGNKSILCRQNSAWNKVFDEGRIDVFPHLVIHCRSHKTRRSVIKGADFEAFAPDGGCRSLCSRKLSCGHVCPRMCHFDDANHTHGAVHCLCVVSHRCEHAHPLEITCASRAAKTFRCDVCDQLQKIAADRQHREAALNRERQDLEKRHIVELKRANDEREVAEQTIKRQQDQLAADMKLNKVRADAELVKQQAALLKEQAGPEKEAQLKQLQDENRDRLRTLESRLAAESRALDVERDRVRLEAERKEQEARRLHQEVMKQRDAMEARQLEAARLKHLETVRAIEADSRRREQDQIAQRQKREQDHAKQLHDLLLKNNEANERLLAEIGRVGLGPFNCCICDDDVPRAVVRVCGNGHYYCAECFNNMIQHGSHSVAIEERIRHHEHGHPQCSFGQCNFCFNLQLVALWGDHSTLDAFERGLRGVAEYKAIKAHEAERERLERVQADVCERVFTHIVNDILTLKCPRCKTAFIDFNGCCALTCETCKCGFCAWCLTDCGGDAHGHIPTCAVRRDVFTQLAEWKIFQRERQMKQVDEYLNNRRGEVDAAMRDKLMERIKRLR